MTSRRLTALFAVLAACGISAGHAQSGPPRGGAADEPLTGAHPGVAPAMPTAAAASSARLDRLGRHPKIHGATDVLARFRQGEPEVRVIVTLQPPEAADELALRSQQSARVPGELRGEGAPVFYDLEDRNIRSRLRQVVTERVGKVLDQLDIPTLSVTQRFSYQTAFAALVTVEGLERLLETPEVLRVERDWELEAHTLQGVALMNAEQPSSSYDGSGLSIAICDTGIDTSHPMLRGSGDSGTTIFNTKVIGGWDAGDNDGDPRPNPNGSAHGTACAGIAAGNLGVVGDYDGGVAPGAKLYSIKISSGDGGSAYTSDMIEGWEWAVTHQDDDPSNPIEIISTSFGGGRYYDQGSCDGASPAMTAAAANAVAAGITIFASSGNDGYCSSMAWPACISYVNSVGAVYDGSLGTLGWCVSYDSACSTKASYNSGCPTLYAAFDSTTADKVAAYSNSAPFLTLFAPSNHAYTTDIVGTGGYTTGDYIATFGGTSAASPYAAGAAAVLQSAAKARTGQFLTPAEVRDYLTRNGDAVTDGKIPSVTRPRINLANSVAALPASNKPSISIGDARANEGSASTVLTFVVDLSAPSASPVTVSYATVNGTATAGSDFTATSGNLSFAAGETRKTITVEILGDATPEPDETFFVNLSSAIGATIADAQGVGTIVNDDAALPTLHIGDVSAAEGNSGARAFAFPVALSAASAGPVTVRYATANGTATTANRDYSKASGTLTIPAGSTGQVVNVSVRGDTKREANETFYVNLSGATGAAIADGQGVGTILNDD